MPFLTSPRRLLRRVGAESSTNERLPLSALCHTLDAASRPIRWLLHADGVPGRALVIPDGSAVTFPLALAHDVVFTSRAMLLPHDWRDRRGAAQVAITVTVGGATRQLWSTALRSSDQGRPWGRQVRCTIPAGADALTLSVKVRDARGPFPLARAILVDPAITDARAPRRPTSPMVASPVGAAPTAPTPNVPLISVLMPVHDPPPTMLEEAIASVRNQTVSGWELCIVDDGSSDPRIPGILQRHTDADPRIRHTRHVSAGGISAATNTAVELASGQYIALLDHDDLLTPDALDHVARMIASRPSLDMVYSDEAIVGDDGRVIWTHHKPDWSPDTLRTNGYTCHLGVYRRDLVRSIGMFRSSYDGSQDVDMILRLVEKTDQIAHIPRILYHWRAHSASTAGSGDQAKPYAYVAARNAIASHLARTGQDARVGFGPPGLYRVAHSVDATTSVDVVLHLDTTDGLREAAAAWLAQPHPSWHAIIAAAPGILADARAVLEDVGVTEARITEVPTETDSISALAGAAQAATAEHLLLMTRPAAGITHDWLTRLIGYSAQPQVAAAGPVMVCADGRIHEAGIAMPEGIPLHLLHGTRSSMDRLFGYGTSVYNVSAVSGALVTRRAVHDQVGGLDPSYGQLALIDYCLRAAGGGRRVVVIPDARLRACGRDPTINDLPRLWRLRNTWAATHGHDPYYNPNYRADRGDFVAIVV